MIQGDIAAQSADALVNAAGTSPEMGSGVAGFDLEDGACIIGETVAESRPNTSMTSGPSATATTRSRRYGAARTGPTADSDYCDSLPPGYHSPGVSGRETTVHVAWSRKQSQ